MKSFLTRLKSFSSLKAASAAFGALFLSGAAFAITDSAFNYTTPKTGYFGISNLGMAPQSDTDSFLNPGMSGGLDGTSCFHRGVNLPNGAVITGLVVYFASGAPGNVVASLKRQKLSNGAEQNIGSKSFTDASFNRVSDTVPITASRATVINAQYNYGFQVCLTVASFFGAGITYTYKNAGD
jgi:hypothetical protein